MSSEHHYHVQVEWRGNKGSGTSSYKDYGREHRISAPSKADIRGSADPAFLGDASCWNPEELLISAVSACHKLWYLHLCADAGITVLSYLDRVEGTMDGRQGRFTSVVLQPEIIVKAGSDCDMATLLHELAHKKCYIANSLNFPVHCRPVVREA
jgi:organic hydroperoxide reductase OsmC/OhrA